MGLIIFALIVHLFFWLTVIAGIAGLSMFIPSLVGYIKTRSPKNNRIMVIGLCMMIPIALIGLYVGLGTLSSNARDYNSIYHQVNSGTVEGMELLKKGVDPDCSWSDVPAKAGEYTLLANFANYNSHHKDTYEKMKLLIEYGADVNWKSCPNCRGGYGHGQPYCEYTPLMLVCERPGEQAEDIIDLLLENGADVNAKDYSGKTALDIINESIQYGVQYGNGVSEKYLKMRKQLISHGAKPGRGT